MRYVPLIDGTIKKVNAVKILVGNQNSNYANYHGEIKPALLVIAGDRADTPSNIVNNATLYDVMALLTPGNTADYDYNLGDWDYFKINGETTKLMQTDDDELEVSSCINVIDMSDIICETGSISTLSDESNLTATQKDRILTALKSQV